MIALLSAFLLACPQGPIAADAAAAPEGPPMILDISGLTRIDEIAELRGRMGDLGLPHGERMEAHGRWLDLRVKARSAEQIAEGLVFLAAGAGAEPEITAFRDQRALAVRGTQEQMRICREAVAAEQRMLSVVAKIHRVSSATVAHLLAGRPWVELTEAEREALIDEMAAGEGEHVQTQSLINFTGSIGDIAAFNRTPYIADYKLVASGGVQVADPVIEVIDSGSFLKVVGVVLEDRIRVRVSHRFTELDEPIRAEEVTLPGTDTRVTIQLPTVDTIEVASTFDVGPEGGTVALAAAGPWPAEDGGSGQAVLVILEVSLVEDEPNPKGNR